MPDKEGFEAPPPPPPGLVTKVARETPAEVVYKGYDYGQKITEGTKAAIEAIMSDPSMIPAAVSSSIPELKAKALEGHPKIQRNDPTEDDPRPLPADPFAEGLMEHLLKKL